MKTYIITGASGGIGSGIAKRLAKEGCNLVLCGNKNTEGLLETYKACAPYADCLQLCGDLSSEIFVQDIMKAALSRFQHIDGLVHAAGIASLGLLTDLTLSDWKRLMDTNLTSAYLLCKALMPHLISKKDGHILLISSVWGTRGASCEVAYSASKGGLNSFTKALAKELAPSGIAVNALAPGMVDTAMNHMLTKEEVQAVIDEIPACRMTTPDEIGEMVSLLLKAPSYLTGQIIGFNGGWE